jgi:hypothetical protein
MTSRSPMSVRAIRLLCTACIITLIPATAWVQEQAPAGAAQQGVPAQIAPSQPASVAAPVSPSVEQQGTYMIRQGDTLWDIANTAYRDPFLWPLIWKSNPSINDPDLIYPGTALVIPSLAPVERAMSAPEEPAPVQEKAVEKAESAASGAAHAATASAVPQEETAAPAFFRQRPAESAEPTPTESGSRLILPEDAPVPIMDKYGMLRAGFISEEPSQDYLEGSVEDKSKGSQSGNLASFDQEVFIVVRSRETVNAGDRFLIYEVVHDVKHPITGKYVGKLYKVNGILKVTGTKEKNVYIARITLSFDAAVRGNLLAPYQEPTLTYPSAQKQTKNLAGHILEVTDRQSFVGQTYVVFLDMGKEDGVEPGDRFTVLSEPSPLTGVRRPIAEVQVYVVKARTATALVRKSADAISKGYPVQSKN